MKMIQWNQLTTEQQNQLLQRPQLATNAQVLSIIDEVKQNGDSALREFTRRFDGVQLESLAIKTDVAEPIDSAFSAAITLAIRNINAVHQALKPSDISLEVMPGVNYQRQFHPIQTVGLYVPGGTAPLISSLLMQAIPATLAGVPNIIVCSPIGKRNALDARLVAAAKLCGIETIYPVGGAQAIAAMAYGTQTIPKVDKIFGPGNSWVTSAKQQITLDPTAATTDLPAGPSEVCVIADNMANAQCIAADLLAQAEHGADSQAILLTDSPRLAQAVDQAIREQLPSLSRSATIQSALAHSAIIITDDLEQAITISNTYAPEHLLLQCEQAERCIAKITRAGAVFVGPWTPETFGDYIVGSNHVLPTSGTAKSCSGLSVIDFMTAISVQTVSQSGFATISQAAQTLAQAEGLDAHARAVSIREVAYVS